MRLILSRDTKCNFASSSRHDIHCKSRIYQHAVIIKCGIRNKKYIANRVLSGPIQFKSARKI